MPDDIAEAIGRGMAWKRATAIRLLQFVAARSAPEDRVLRTVP
jgi:hypothetical protein